MTAESLNRRLAAWLLTLPAPIQADSRDAALRQAKARVDPSASVEDLARAFAELGYDLRATREGYAVTFALKPAA